MDEPELEQVLIERTFRYFSDNGQWPSVDRLHAIVVREGLAEASLSDVLTIFSRHSGTFIASGIASLPLSDLLDMPAAEWLRHHFVQIVRLMAKKFRATPDDQKPVLTSGEAGQTLKLDAKELRQLYWLFQSEGMLGYFATQSLENPDPWDVSISADIMLFRDVTTLGEYLAKRDTKWPQLRRESVRARPGPRAVAFLLMPFDSTFDWLHDEIVAAGNDANLEVHRADDIFESGIVIDQIKAAIAQADAVIAVCTDRNANVFYELGIAEAKHKPILIAKDRDDLPFDVQHFRAHLYGGTGPGNSRATLRTRITAALHETIPAATRVRHGQPLSPPVPLNHGVGRDNLSMPGMEDPPF